MGYRHEMTFQMKALMLLIAFVILFMDMLPIATSQSTNLSKRPKFLKICITTASTAFGISILGATHPISPTHAVSLQEPKQTKLSNDAIAHIVKDDIDIRQALVSESSMYSCITLYNSLSFIIIRSQQTSHALFTVNKPLSQMR